MSYKRNFPRWSLAILGGLAADLELASRFGELWSEYRSVLEMVVQGSPSRP
jgi:hypothetical protein